MNLNRDDERMVFAISTEDVQDVAVSLLERRLTDDEMRTAEKCIDSGLSFGIDIVFKAAVEEAVGK
jgi:hypothetical protein